MKKYLTLLGLLIFPLWLSAQYLTGIATYYSDSFAEWQIFTEYEDEQGQLELRWRDDWTEWNYSLGESFGTIRMKWRDKPDEWELRGDNRIVTARAIWPGEIREWRITDNSTTLTLRSRYSNQFDEWELRNSRNGDFQMYTNWERDPRDWVIVDELDGDVSFEMKMMMVFIVVFHSSPKQ